MTLLTRTCCYFLCLLLATRTSPGMWGGTSEGRDPSRVTVGHLGAGFSFILLDSLQDGV